MSLTSLDGQCDDEIKHLTNVGNMTFVVFRVPLPFRRLWNYTVLAHGCDEHPLTNSTLLSNNNIIIVLVLVTSSHEAIFRYT